MYVVFYKYPICCGMGVDFHQCLLFRQRGIFNGKDALLEQQSDLMNRLIHRSWGESFVDIFLDLPINISCAHH